MGAYRRNHWVHITGISIPTTIQSEFVVAINSQEIRQYSAIQFYEHIKSKIDHISIKRNEIDCVIVYIPNAWKSFRELKNEQTYFDLHDSLKLYAVKKGLRLQFIEDKSINCKHPINRTFWQLSVPTFSQLRFPIL